MSQGLCTSCGAALNLTAGETETKCQYCDNVVTLQKAEAHLAVVKNSRTGGALLLAQMSLASFDYPQALKLFDKVIEQDERAAEAWFGRGICWAKNEGSINTDQAVSSWDAAVLFASNPEAMGRRAALEIAALVSEQLKNAGELEDGWMRRYNNAELNHLLGWAIGKDTRSELLLRTGAEFYRWAKQHTNDTGSYYEGRNHGRELDESIKINSAKFQKALAESNPDLANALNQRSDPARFTSPKGDVLLQRPAMEIMTTRLLWSYGTSAMTALKQQP